MADSAELFRQARLQGIKKVAGGEEAGEGSGGLREGWQEREGQRWHLEAAGLSKDVRSAWNVGGTF